MFSMSTFKIKKSVDNEYNETYNVLKEHMRRGENMKKEVENNLEEIREDGKEMVEIVARVPADKKERVLGIIEGAAIETQKAG